MDGMPLRWQSASRLDALRRTAGERVEQWLAQWFASGARPAHALEALAASGPEGVDSDIHWYRLRDGRGTLHLRAVGDAVARLGCRIAGLEAPDAAGLAVGLGRRALTDLAHRFVSPAAPTALDAVQGGPEAWAVGTRYGAAGLRLSLDAIRIELHVDAEAFAGLLPAQRPPAVALVPRAQALGPLEARFDARLDLGRLALADIPALRPGEVLKTEVPLSRGIRLYAVDGRCVLSGQLAEQDGHRALQVIEAPSVPSRSAAPQPTR